MYRAHWDAYVQALESRLDFTQTPARRGKNTDRPGRSEGPIVDGCRGSIEIVKLVDDKYLSQTKPPALADMARQGLGVRAIPGHWKGRTDYGTKQ